MRQRGGAALGICIMEGREAYISILNYYILKYIIIIYNIIDQVAAVSILPMPRCRTAALPRMTQIGVCSCFDRHFNI
jgi:hypothetical protein